MPTKLVYTHEEGCGGPAFYLHNMPLAGESLISTNIEMLDGDEPPASMDGLVRGACGDDVRFIFVDQVSEVDV